MKTFFNQYNVKKN